MTADTSPAVLVARITNYLSAGGLFNPEAMEHDKVRDLLIDCRAALAAAPASPPSVRDRLEAFRSGWDEGYAEGYGKAKSEAAAPASPPSDEEWEHRVEEMRQAEADAQLVAAERDELISLRRSDEKLREALRFYADEENYSMGYYHPEDADLDHVESHGPLVLDDCGSRARAALGEQP